MGQPSCVVDGEGGAAQLCVMDGEGGAAQLCSGWGGRSSPVVQWMGRVGQPSCV